MHQDTAIHVKDFKTLKVWRKAMDLAKDIYRVTSNFPAFETYAAKSQIIRCTTSIAANIAEGSGQIYPKKELNFINNALGSASESRHWLELSLMNSYISENDFQTLDAKVVEIIKMLIGYMRKIQTQLQEDA